MTPEQEKDILKFWQEKNIFSKSLKQTQKGQPFVFYEGPPTANGQPGLHHILARSFKDIVCRFRTMQGRYVARQAGWDTHGLPVEVQVEKELGLKSKKDIENIVPGNKRQSIIAFNQKCRDSVWRYQDLWEDLTSRMGYWLDMEHPYITYQPEYIESLWHLISEIDKKGLLYQGHKVLPWCPRCGTGLSSHEVAQGYQTVTDNSVFVKFKLAPGQKIKGKEVGPNTYLLSWTTTPWTLPGNVALAVGKNIKYLAVNQNQETLILAEELVGKVLEGEFKKESSFSGKDLVGLKYEPLFKIPELVSSTSHQVYSADFVETESGTGIVHTAVMYGEDDYTLGQKHNLPTIHTVDDTGRFLDFVPDLAGLKVKDTETEKKILSLLEKQNSLFKTLPYEHEYPHCWRCDTPVLYYARSSWFIKMSALKNQLLKNNQEINWVPDHLKNGRMGEWLAGVKDWAFSRERYWATPLPIWQCANCGEQKIIGSLEELDKSAISSGNRFFLMRHGEAKSNTTKRLSSYPEKFKNSLTPKGQKDILAAAKKLRSKKIDIIISSDLTRAKETAAILAKELGIKKVLIDKRLQEKDFKAQNGLLIKQEDPTQNEPVTKIRARMFTALTTADQKYQNKNILFISHGEPLSVLSATAETKSSPMLKTGQVKEIKFKRYPRNDEGLVDLHRPFIDEIKLACPKCEGAMTRVPELADVWFDAGAMPFASKHFPFTTKKLTKSDFPADYICEAVDQTRGWFYTLLATTALMDKGPAYRNVISLGHINDKHGKKMSKSKGNIVDPWEMMDRYGADVVRWHLYTINSPGETKNFDENDLKKVKNNVFNILKNCLVFYQTYGIKTKFSPTSKNVLDRWIKSRLSEASYQVTSYLENYDVYRAATAIESLINDLSRWYIRRSRPRFQQPESAADLKAASATLYEVLFELGKLLAPFAPFTAEILYRELKGKKESVHLEPWAKPKTNPDQNLLIQMSTARELSSLGLSARADANLKVRQPLTEMKVSKDTLSGVEGSRLSKEIIDIITDEVNVKNIHFGHQLVNEVELDTNITPALRAEGQLRELIRAIQGLRAEASLNPGELATLYLACHSESAADEESPDLVQFINKNRDQLQTACSLKALKITTILKPKATKNINLDSLGPLTLSIK